MPDLDENTSEETTNDSGTQVVNYITETVPTKEAKTLTLLTEPESGQAFIMVNTNNNQGLLLDYSLLRDLILEKLYSETMPEDGIKVYYVS